MIASDRTSDSVAELLCAISFTTGLGMGPRMEHGLFTAYIGLRLADALGLPAADRESVYYGAFLKDVGCSACAAGLAAFFPDDELVPGADFILVDSTSMRSMFGWLARHLVLDASLPVRLTKLTAFVAQCGPIVKEAMTAHCEIAEMFARRLEFPEHVQQALRYQFERWDGKGLAYGVGGDGTPIAARILQAGQILELAHSFGGPGAAQTLARERSGTRFDPQVAGAFLALAGHADFWSVMEQDDAQAYILAMRPPTSAEVLGEDRIDAVCDALADFTDVKTRQTWNHSRSVAAEAEGIGQRLGLDATDQTKVRRAALVHDIGLAGLPFGILAKEGRWSEEERESYRLHPYLAQRVLERVGPLRDLATDVAGHHEWVNGQGYHQRLSGDRIPLNARILATADTYTDLMQQSQTADPDAVRRELRAVVGSQLDAACVEALAGATSAPPLWRPSSERSLAALTERETEVLQHMARGLSNPAIAEALVVSRRTVEHHVEHIFDKIGVSSRTAAVVYAVQNGVT